MFENRKTKVGRTHYTRYIESWRRVGGDLDINSREFFWEWLRSEDCTEDEIYYIWNLATLGGKFELQQSAKPYVKNYYESRGLTYQE